jgi:hypothetical protein
VVVDVLVGVGMGSVMVVCVGIVIVVVVIGFVVSRVVVVVIEVVVIIEVAVFVKIVVMGAIRSLPNIRVGPMINLKIRAQRRTMKPIEISSFLLSFSSWHLGRMNIIQVKVERGSAEYRRRILIHRVHRVHAGNELETLRSVGLRFGW